MKANTFTLTTLAAVGIIMIMIMTPVGATPQGTVGFTPNAIITDIKLEFIDIAAGIDSSAYVSNIIYGGSYSFPSQISPSVSGFSQALAWFVLGVNQTGVDAHLTRNPLDVPDGVTLQLVYPKTISLTTALSHANEAKGAVEAKYGISMVMVFGVQTPNAFVFSFNGGGESAINAVITDVQAVSSGGFDDYLSVLPTSGVRGAGFGIINIGGGNSLAVHGGFFVNSGLVGTKADGTTKFISTDSIFGGDVNGASDADLSRIRINVPYPITPTLISPTTSNRLPHVTGTAFWDLNHPRSEYELGNSASDYRIEFIIGMERQFPMVENKLTIDQGKVNTEGILEFKYALTNTGQAEAKNIELALPLGPEIKKILNTGIKMFTIKDSFYLNESFNTKFNISLTLTPSVSGFSDVNFNFLSLDGWYFNSSTNALAGWNTSTEIVLKSQSISLPLGGSATLDLKVLMPDGAPQSAVDAVYDFIKPAVDGVTVTSSSDLDELATAIKDSIPAALNATFYDARATYYDEIEIMQLNAGNFTIVEKPVGLDENTINQTFLEASVSSLAVGAATNLSFSITNVPSQTDTFALMKLIKGTTSTGGVTYNTLTLESKTRDYFELMQYFFANINYDGMPITFQINPSHSPIPGITEDTYLSVGVPFTWENAQGFEFFGLANGANLQIADNQAIIAATVRFGGDEQVFTVGDEIQIIVDLTNSGDADASDVKVRLFHSRLGRDWDFVNPQEFAVIDVGTLAKGASTSVSVNVTANSFIGYHPVFAVVDFTSEKGEPNPTITDFFDLGITEYQYGGESHHWVTSTLTGGLLLPSSDAAKPAVPEPRIEVTTSTSTPNAAGEFTHTITLTNVGDAGTDVTAFQTFSSSEFELVSSSSSKGTVNSLTFLDQTYVKLEPTAIAVNESITITLNMKLKGTSGVIPSAVVTFDTPGQSSLGDRAIFGIQVSAATSVGGSLLSLAASASAQGQSQASATQQGSSSAYSSSGSVFASSSGGGELTSSSVVVSSAEGPSFIGYDPLTVVMAMAIPITLIIHKRRSKLLN